MEEMEKRTNRQEKRNRKDTERKSTRMAQQDTGNNRKNEKGSRTKEIRKAGLWRENKKIEGRK